MLVSTPKLQRRHPRSKSGFSMIEVMMATTILLVGFVGMIQAVTIGSESLDTARKQQVAHQIVTEEIENLRSGAWSAVTSLPATATVSINDAGTITGDTSRFTLSNHSTAKDGVSSDMSVMAKGFSCTVAREFLRPTSATAINATYTKVTYTVTWKSNTGHVQSHQVSTYIGKNGLHLSYQQS